MFGGILGRIANTVHNDVVAPIQRDVIHPVLQGAVNVDNTVAHPFVQAWQHINPNSGVNQARPFVKQAMNMYHVTPQFQAIINGGNPSMAPNIGANGDLVNNLNAAAQTDMSNPVNQLQLGPHQGSTPAAIIHEALHRQWALNPSDHQNFINAYQQTNDPNLKSYLIQRLSGYKGFAQSPVDSLMNLNHLAPMLQNEVHSYVPEYYQLHPQVALDGPLGNYYSKYFAPNFPQQAEQQRQIATNITKAIPSIYPPSLRQKR